MSFERPDYLILILILLPLGLLSGIASHAKKNRILRVLGSIGLISSFSNLDHGLRKKMLVLYLSSLSLLILAASGPQIHKPRQIKEGGFDLLVALDVSRSMSAEDFGSGTRLQKAKNMIEQVMASLNGNRIALVTFAGTPFEQAPLTNDYKAIRFILKEWVDINSVQKAGSDILSALETSVKVLDRSDRNRLMLVLSDGGGKLDAQRAGAVYQSIREGKIKTVVAGIGSKKGYLLKKSENDKNLVLTALDEDSLKKIARECGGVYLDGNGDPIRITADIFSQKVIGEDAFEGKQSVYPIPLILSVLIFGMAFKL